MQMSSDNQQPMTLNMPVLQLSSSGSVPPRSIHSTVSLQLVAVLRESTGLGLRLPPLDYSSKKMSKKFQEQACSP
jgi:hypothetical protein